MRTHAFLYLRTVLLALALTLAVGSRAASTQVAVQKDPPWPLWLPAPGLPGSAPPESAPTTDARERGLAAARNGDWPSAVAAFTEALDTAHATPSLMFNLGLAYQKRGWAIPAALWYRAYLEAVPDAANAPVVRTETERLVAETQAESLRLFDEAERLADALPAAAPSADTKSPRQAALEQIVRYLYMGGLTERAEILSQKIEALPGARPLAEIQDRCGFFAANRSLDAGRTRQVLPRLGANYSKGLRFEEEMRLQLQRRALGEALRMLETDRDQTVSFRFAGVRAYDAMLVNHTRVMEKAREFDAKGFTQTIFPELEKACYDGRPDVSRALAKSARAYLRKFRIAGWPDIQDGHIWMLDALLGDREALQNDIRRYDANYSSAIYAAGDDPADGMMAARTAMAIAANIPPAEAVPLIDELLEKGRLSAITPEGWARVLPLSHFVRWVAAGNESQALAILDFATEEAEGNPERAKDRRNHEIHLEYALRFAVATRRDELALALADRQAGHSTATLTALNRLALAPGVDPAVVAKVEEYAARVGAGWRPRDAAQAWAVSLRQDVAYRDSEDEAYRSLEEVLATLEKSMRDKPEKMPGDMAGYAVIRWVATLRARPDL